MKITHGSVTIIKLGDEFMVSENHLKPAGSLGTYSSLREALDTCIARVSIPKIKGDLEAIRERCEALGWDDEKIEGEFAV